MIAIGCDRDTPAGGTDDNRQVLRHGVDLTKNHR